jgi:hypothetical protein
MSELRLKDIKSDMIYQICSEPKVLSFKITVPEVNIETLKFKRTIEGIAGKSIDKYFFDISLATSKKTILNFCCNLDSDEMDYKIFRLTISEFDKTDECFNSEWFLDEEDSNKLLNILMECFN